MKNRFTLLLLVVVSLLPYGCAPFDKIYSHDFSSGYYKLKGPETSVPKVYVETNGDSLTLYPANGIGKSLTPDLSSPKISAISSIAPNSNLYNSTFVRTSADIDLSTILLKYRPHAGNVPSQLSTNVNGIFYVGFRKDFFKVISHVSPGRVRKNSIRHTGFDFGPYAGIGIAPVNYTVTMNATLQEYDGIVFQKGFAVFGTVENMSVGFSIGFDNLLDKNKNIWVFNGKPYFGIIIGIANF
jgi:hypothetical protein